MFPFDVSVSVDKMKFLKRDQESTEFFWKIDSLQNRNIKLLIWDLKGEWKEN